MHHRLKVSRGVLSALWTEPLPIDYRKAYGVHFGVFHSAGYLWNWLSRASPTSRGGTVCADTDFARSNFTLLSENQDSSTQDCIQ